MQLSKANEIEFKLKRFPYLNEWKQLNYIYDCPQKALDCWIEHYN